MARSTLQTLIIKDNSIGVGVEALADALREESCQITHLDVSSNKLGDRYAVSVKVTMVD